MALLSFLNLLKDAQNKENIQFATAAFIILFLSVCASINYFLVIFRDKKNRWRALAVFCSLSAIMVDIYFYLYVKIMFSQNSNSTLIEIF